MKILLPNDVSCEVVFQPGGESSLVAIAFSQGPKPLGSFELRGDAYPELRYLLILYFYNEFIPVNGKAPHAITLEEYVTIYEAMFGCKCVYKDKTPASTTFAATACTTAS